MRNIYLLFPFGTWPSRPLFSPSVSLSLLLSNYPPMSPALILPAALSGIHRGRCSSCTPTGARLSGEAAVDGETHWTDLGGRGTGDVEEKGLTPWPLLRAPEGLYLSIHCTYTTPSSVKSRDSNRTLEGAGGSAVAFNFSLCIWTISIRIL